MLHQREMELMAEFEFGHDLIGDKIEDAYNSAESYGQAMVDFRFATRYFIMATDDSIHCWPAVRPEATMADFLDHLLLTKYTE